MDYDERDLVSRLAAIGRAEKTAVAAAWAERLWPLFERYARTTGREDAPSLAEALAAVWRVAAGESDDDLVRHQHVAEELVPDEDEGWIWESGYAQNAAASVAYAARTWLTDDPQEAAWAARQVFEAADYAAQHSMTARDLNAPGAVQKILESSIVQAALQAIEADLRLVEREGHVAVGALRERARRDGYSWAAELP